MYKGTENKNIPIYINSKFFGVNKQKFKNFQISVSVFNWESCLGKEEMSKEEQEKLLQQKLFEKFKHNRIGFSLTDVFIDEEKITKLTDIAAISFGKSINISSNVEI